MSKRFWKELAKQAFTLATSNQRQLAELKAQLGVLMQDLTAVKAKESIMSTRTDKLESDIATINLATNQVASVVTEARTTIASLKAQLGEGATAEQLDALDAELAGVASHLTAIGANPDNVVPPAPDSISDVVTTSSTPGDGTADGQNA
jgi:septal ring factor EnvC (AmiA/AmiB activator)